MSEQGAETQTADHYGPARFRPIPRWVKIAVAVWVAAWFPIYLAYYGWANFLHLSDVAVALLAIGLWTSSSLLVSSQAVSVLIGETLWCVDFLLALATGRRIFGGIGYMWDQHYPLWLRLMSLYHFLLPVVLVWGVWRLGYDRRALKLQMGIAAIVLIASRIWGRPENINFAYRDPVFRRSWGPAPVHLLFMFACMVVILYLPTHWVLAKLFGRPRRQGG